MTRRTFALALIAAMAVPHPVRADDCAAVRDADRRAACQGRTRSASDCESIRDADRRAACRDEARR